MIAPQKAAFRPLRWLRRLLLTLLVLAVASGLALYFLYVNLTEVVVWFANRAHPRLAVEAQHARFVTKRRIEITHVSLKLKREREEVLGIETAVIDFTWRGLLARRIDRIRIEKPRVFASDHLLGGTDQKPPPPSSSPSSAGGLWRVEEFNVSGGKADVDLSFSPRIRFEFATDLHAVYLSAETKFSTASQTLDVSHVEFLGRDSRHVRFGTIKSLGAHFTLDHLAQNKLDDLTVTGPSIWVTPALLAAFGASGSNDAKAAAPGSGAALRPSPSWVIGSLHLSDGEFFMDGFGPLSPEASFKFGIDEEDLQLGADAGALLEKTHDAQLWDVRIASSFAPLNPYLLIDSVQIDFTAGGLFARKELKALTVTGLDFQMDRKFRSFMAAVDQNTGKTVQPRAAAAKEDPPWTIRDLDINNGRVTISDLGVELPTVGFKLDTEMKDVALSPDIRYASKEIEEVVMSDLTINAPQDPFLPVLNFSEIRLRFSLAQILGQEIDEVIFEKPTIFIGEQLFWYADELKRRENAPAATAPQAPPDAASQQGWRINRFRAEDGRLMVANAGHASVGLPFKFKTKAENLRFNNLSDLKLNLNLEIPEADYPFASYQLEFKRLYGDIKFGLPPDTNSKNVVQTLHAAGARWKQFEGEQLWLSVTYDKDGIYGTFGGAGYHGYLNGQFNFFMLSDTPWTGWVSGAKVDLQKITDVLAPENFQMSGPADFKVEVNGLNHEIERVSGRIRTAKPGRLKIGKLDSIIAAIPNTWSGVKQGVTRITLETLRDFDYTSANGDFWYSGERGRLTLKMGGPHGSRNFDVTLHGD